MDLIKKSFSTVQLLWIGIALSVPAFLWNLGSVFSL